MIWLAYIPLVLTGLMYMSLLRRVRVGLKDLREQTWRLNTAKRRINVDDLPNVSVIIAARNEEKRIRPTLESLAAQKYPLEKTEIIIVDDRSTDNTGLIVEQFAKDHPQFRVIRQVKYDPQTSPKKQALALGIAESRGEIILTTDADCTHDSKWIKALVVPLTCAADMTIGQARFEVDNNAPLWQGLQALDFRSQGYVSAGLIQARTPYNCSGASLAFTRKMFDKINGYKGVDGLISGDDELLMAKAHRFGLRIVNVANPAAIVMTQPVETLKELWQQRVRWGSKGIYYGKSKRFWLSGVFFFHLFIVIGLILDLVLRVAPLVWLFFGLKIWLDWLTMRQGSKTYSEKFDFADFILAELVHPFMIVSVPIAGHFGHFEWKGQRYHSKGVA